MVYGYARVSLTIVNKVDKLWKKGAITSIVAIVQFNSLLVDYNTGNSTNPKEFLYANTIQG